MPAISFGIGVAGDDDLLVRLDQGVEGVEELLLRTALVGEELDVVDEQQVERVVVALELVEGLLLIGAHHVGDVLLGVDVPDASVGPRVGERIADRLHQVGLAQAHAAIDEQRVIGNAGVFGHLDRRSAGELVRLAGHEAVERESPVEARALRQGWRLRNGARRGLGGSRGRIRTAREHQPHAELAAARLGG